MPYSKNPERIPTIVEALENQSVEQLKKLITYLPTTQKVSRKAELVNLVSNYLNNETSLYQLWQKLDQLQQAAVAEVVYSSQTQFDAIKFKAKYRQLPNFDNSDRYNYNSQPSLLRLFFYSYNIIPDEMKLLLKKFVPRPVDVKLISVSELPPFINQRSEEYNSTTKQYEQKVTEVTLVQREMERSAQQDLMAILRLINAGKLTVSDKTNHPTAATVKAITAVLSGGDYYIDKEPEERPPYQEPIGPIRAFAWSLILQAAGLAELSEKKLRLTKAGQKALVDPPEKTLKLAWEKWVNNKTFDELRRIETIKGQTGKGKQGLTVTSERRQAIAIILRDSTVNSWVEVNDFLRYLLAVGYNFQITRNIESLYICDAHYGTLYDPDAAWNILQGRYILCLLFEYAATLGMLDVAYVSPSGARYDYQDFWGAEELEFFSRYDGLMYFRLTPLGAYCLGVTNNYQPAPIEVRPVLQVLPNLEITPIAEPLTGADMLLLDIYTEKVSDTTWKLQDGKLLNAIAEGNNISVFQEFIQAKSGNLLPETARQFIADIKARSHSLKDKGTARIIECKDADLARLIANNPQTKPYCMLLGERCLVVPTTSEIKFHDNLIKLGYSLVRFS